MLFSCLFALIMQLYGAPEIKMAVWQVGCDAAGMDVEPCGIGEEAPIIMRSVAIDARTGRPIGEVI